MNSTPYRRIVAVVGAAAIIIITARSAAASLRGAPAAGRQDRPCFMVRAHWNTAEGPQPTCPVPSWQRA